MELKHDYWQGQFEDILGTFIKSISQYSINHNGIKIGITNDPEKRLKEHITSNVGWKKMIIKYETTSINYINVMEELLINYHWEILSNIRGNVGETHKTPPYYLYIVIK